MNKAAGLLVRVERMADDRIYLIEEALISAYPTLKRSRDSSAGEIYLWGKWKLDADDRTLADAIGALVWATNGRYCAVEVTRWEKGQWPGQGGRTLSPKPSTAPANSLGMTDAALDEMVGHWREDDGERHCVRDIKRVLLTANQKRILDEHDLNVADVLNGRCPMVLGDAVNRMLRDWNDRLGFDYFTATDLGDIIDAIEDGFNADLLSTSDGFTLAPRQKPGDQP